MNPHSIRRTGKKSRKGFRRISHRQEYEGRHSPTNHRGTASDRGGAAARAVQSVDVPVRAPSKTTLAVNHL